MGRLPLRPHPDVVVGARPAARRARPAPPEALPHSCRRFTGQASCSDCASMAEYVADEELVADCHSCCVVDKDSVKYQSARLEVCPYRLR